MGSGIRGFTILFPDDLFSTAGDKRLGAEVTPEPEYEEAIVTGRGWAGPVFSLSSADSGSQLFLDFLLLSVDTPESLELRVEEGKSVLVSRKPGQI